MKNSAKNIQWIDGVKAFGILGILLNHLVESFKSGPWFSNPEYNWPSFSVRMANLFPSGNNFAERVIRFLGWLGDMGPGVFILVSGLTLTLSALKKPLKPIEFYRKRLLRIYPLYVTIHLLILIVAKFWFKWDIHFFSAKTVLSILGLRFTDSLFFYINPSWWFIWLIIQMYFLFPFLFLLLQKRGVRVFLLVTFLATILSRLCGLEGITYSRSLYYWMTGIFAGSRLFEFSFGMYLGYLLSNQSPSFAKLLDNKPKVFLYSFCIYGAGFVLSWTYVGSLFSNILISVGLTGLFYSIFEIVISRIDSLKNVLVWIGKNSFSVFLLHQPFMMYASTIFNNSARGIALVIVIILSFFVGYFIEKIVNLAIKKAETRRQWIDGLVNSRGYRVLIVATIFGAAFTSFAIMLAFTRFNGTLKLLLLLSGIGIAILRIGKKFKQGGLGPRFFDLSLLISGVIFLLTENWLSTYWVLMILGSFLLVLTSKLRHYISLSFAVIMLLGGICFLENHLQRNHPLEGSKWGEYPILQMDSQTVYSLIPNRTTHLKYNNYDYFVRTNSTGFASEEVSLDSKNNNTKRILVLGDAFSMPEGVEYADSYPFLLEQQLRREYPGFKIDIINAGVTGYGPNEEYAQLKKYIGTIRPDVVINQFFVNEFDDINILKEERQMGIGFFSRKSFMNDHFGSAQIPMHLNSYAQKMLGVVDKHFSYVKSLLGFYDRKTHYFDDTVVQKVATYFDSVSYLCKTYGAAYVVLYVPGQIEVSKPADISYYPYFENLKDTARFDFARPQNIVKTLCFEKGISYINSTPFLKSYRFQPVYFVESWHWNKEGHRAVAACLYDYITSKNLLAARK